MRAPGAIGRVTRLATWGALAGVLASAPACARDKDALLPAGEGVAAETRASIADTMSKAPTVVSSDLRAGNSVADTSAPNPYSNDANALAEGRALYTRMNCAGCHGGAGGGAIGPPLADKEWIYGSTPANIVQAILQGRPNGMPSFGARLPESEAWKIATYVKSLETSTP